MEPHVDPVCRLLLDLRDMRQCQKYAENRRGVRGSGDNVDTADSWTRATHGPGIAHIGQPRRHNA